MKIAILGNLQSGQKELFSLLTKISMDTITQSPLDPQIGICEVLDPRLTKLIDMYKPKKKAYAKIEYLLLPDFTNQGPTKTVIFNNLKNSDEICFVCREESARSDISNFVSEMILNDMMLVEKRIETIAKDRSGKFAERNEKEKALMDICREQLEAEKPLKAREWTDEQLKLLLSYQFYTMKSIFLVINIPESRIKEKIEMKELPYPYIVLSVELENEIGELEEPDRSNFLKELGIEEPAVDKMNRMAYEGLGLISFFTVGEDETRAWTIKKGSSAQQAGGAIHSDIEKGFVRAELMKYEDLLSHGSEAKLKETGKFYLKGKDYIVEESDILSFRFNV